jgi:hypothetical protein
LQQLPFPAIGQQPQDQNHQQQQQQEEEQQAERGKEEAYTRAPARSRKRKPSVAHRAILKKAAMERADPRAVFRSGVPGLVEPAAAGWGPPGVGVVELATPALRQKATAALEQPYQAATATALLGQNAAVEELEEALSPQEATAARLATEQQHLAATATALAAAKVAHDSTLRELAAEQQKHEATGQELEKAKQEGLAAAQGATAAKEKAVQLQQRVELLEGELSDPHRLLLHLTSWCEEQKQRKKQLEERRNALFREKTEALAGVAGMKPCELIMEGAHQRQVQDQQQQQQQQEGEKEGTPQQKQQQIQKDGQGLHGAPDFMEAVKTLHFYVKEEEGHVEELQKRIEALDKVAVAAAL